MLAPVQGRSRRYRYNHPMNDIFKTQPPPDPPGMPSGGGDGEEAEESEDTGSH
jgi:hypothetical protein